MLPVFLVIGLALVLAAVLALVRSSSRPPEVAPKVSSDASAPPSTPDATDLLVIVVGPSSGEVMQVTTEFRELYKDQNLVAYPFQAHAVEPGITALTFPQNLHAEQFYYLINYLSYPESGYTTSAQVRGWATLPVVTLERVVSPPEPVMVCVPPNDTEYDLVLLLTPAPAVYKVSFQAHVQAVLLRHAVPVAYTAPPFSLNAVRQLPGTELH